MAIVTSTGFSHVRVTVTDIARSKAFYAHLFGWPIALDGSASAGEPGVVENQQRHCGDTSYQTPQGSFLGRGPVGDAHFDPDQTGSTT